MINTFIWKQEGAGYICYVNDKTKYLAIKNNDLWELFLKNDSNRLSLTRINNDGLENPSFNDLDEVKNRVLTRETL